ncbi:hypothetical protein F2Q68_00024109 [Brassica cretica]|uniref:Uncharacterized protein n=1 Tax=Brassica cretica TaxID=69181 RepID=A0A8S9IB14_BRACR|nr:hypothetical protein F2Q68_00024109 [Brassica cretica]
MANPQLLLSELKTIMMRSCYSPTQTLTFQGPTICLSVFDGMATLLHEKLVASCVEPKVFGGTRISGQLNPVNHQFHDVAPKVFTFNFMAGGLIINAPISTTTKKV